MKNCLAAVLLLLSFLLSCVGVVDPDAPLDDAAQVARGLTGRTANLPPLADAYVRGGAEYANKNFGALPGLDVRNDPVPEQDRNVILRFDLRPLSAIRVTRAVLKLQLVHLPQPTTLKYFGVDDDSWQELAVTYNTLPPPAKYSGLGTLPIVLSQLNTYVAFDVTAFTEAQRAQDGQVSFGVDETMRRIASFASKEAAANPPLLDVTYDTAPVCGDSVCEGPSETCSSCPADCHTGCGGTGGGGGGGACNDDVCQGEACTPTCTDCCNHTCAESGWYEAQQLGQCNVDNGCNYNDPGGECCLKKQWCRGAKCQPWPYYCWGVIP